MIPRLRSIRMKADPTREVRLLRPDDEPKRVVAHLRRDIERITEKGIVGPVAAGYAVVVWGRDGSSSSSFQTYSRSPIGQAMVPDFVRTCLADLLTYRGVVDP